MDAKPNQEATKMNCYPRAENLRAKPMLLLASVAMQAALLYGCAGVVAKNTDTTPPSQPPAGTAQLTVTPSSVSFGSVSDGTTNSQTVQLKNTGDASLTISQATLTGTGFSQSGMSLPMTLAAAATTSFTIKFGPQTAGSVTGTLTLTSTAPDSPLAVPVSGTGTTASLTLSVSPTSLSFGNINVGSASAVQNFKITNTGNANVAVSSIKSTGSGFAITTGGSAVTLTPTQNVTVGVQFTPTAAGNATGSVSVVSNATGSPATVSLTGVGVAAPVSSHTAALNWTPSTSTVSGYNVYRSTVSGGSYSRVNTSLVASAMYSDSTVQSGKTYFYVTTAVDGGNNESGFSNEAQAVIP